MDKVSSIMVGIKQVYNSAASNTSSALFGVKLYHNHTESTTFPFVVYNVISAPNFYSMGTANTAPNSYCIARVQLSAMANEQQEAQGRAIIDAVTQAFSFCTMSNTGHNFMACYPGSESIAFFESDNKVWNNTKEFQVWVGD
jgi:hypothetical protein